MGCWDTLNSERIPEISGSPRIIFCYYAQKYDNESIATFIEMVETGKLRLLEQKTDSGYDDLTSEDYVKNTLPFIQTNFLVEEIVNLKLKKLNNGNLSIDRVVTKVDKDRFSSLQYGLWYAMKFMNNIIEEETDDVGELAKYIMW